MFTIDEAALQGQLVFSTPTILLTLVC